MMPIQKVEINSYNSSKGAQPCNEESACIEKCCDKITTTLLQADYYASNMGLCFYVAAITIKHISVFYHIVKDISVAILTCNHAILKNS